VVAVTAGEEKREIIKVYNFLLSVGPLGLLKKPTKNNMV
jgi:hypothetical protein